jgi:hypothetical protein
LARLNSFGFKDCEISARSFEAEKPPSPLALQPPHDLIELIEAAIAHVHFVGLATVVDRDFEPERGDEPESYYIWIPIRGQSIIRADCFI